MATVSSNYPAAFAPSAQQPRKSGFFSRLFAAMRASRQRRAEREIAEILARQGGIMVDRFDHEQPLHAVRSYPFRPLPALQPRTGA